MTDLGATRPGNEHAEVPEPLESLLDALVYAPIGFACSLRRLWPDLVETGRREAGTQVRTAQMVGRFAVQLVRSQGPGLLRQFLVPKGGVADGAVDRSAAPASPAPPADADAGAAPVGSRRADGPASDSVEFDGAQAGRAPVGVAPSAGPAGLAIEGYDTLPASLVVPRLSGLSASELEAIRAHEQATRARRTILSRIAQLAAERASAGVPPPRP